MIKKLCAFMTATLLLACLVHAGTVTTNFTQRQIRDPRQFETLLENNFRSLVTGTGTLLTDLVMAGPTNATLSFHDAQAAGSTGLISTVTMADIANAAVDTSFVEYRMLVQTNDSSERIVWAKWRFYVDDNTTNTEDAASELWLEIGGTETKVLNIDASGVDAGTLKLLGTGVDAGDANLDNVGVASVDSIVADGGSTVVASNNWTFTGMSRDVVTAQNWTNSHVQTVALPFYLVSPIGQAVGLTNTVTLANPTTAGDRVAIVVAASTTNDLKLADSGNLKLSADWIANDDDVLVLRAISTSAWVEESRSAN